LSGFETMPTVLGSETENLLLAMKFELYRNLGSKD